MGMGRLAGKETRDPFFNRAARVSIALWLLWVDMRNSAEFRCCAERAGYSAATAADRPLKYPDGRSPCLAASGRNTGLSDSIEDSIPRMIDDDGRE